MPLVSVVVPCYNCERTLSRTVGSVRAQTFGDWELILVNDGSTDGTGALAGALAAGDARVRVLSKENGGVSSARNAGIDAARGELVAFADADDLLPPRALEILLSLLDDGADVVCGACETLRAGERGALYCAHGDKAAMMESILRAEGAPNSMCGKLYRASLLRGYHLRAPEGVAIGEDLLFNLDALAASRAWRVTDEIVYVYDMREDSAMGKARGGMYACAGPMLAGIGAYLDKHGLRTAMFRAHIDAWLRPMRAEKGRLGAALCMCGAPARELTRGVDPAALPPKPRLYYHMLRHFPLLSFFLP